MTITMHALAVDTFAPVLTTLTFVLQKGGLHAQGKGIEPDTLARARLAPDMFPLSTQVQLACHHARDAVARLSAATPPKLENQELAFRELQPLLERTLQHLNGMSKAAFDGAEDRLIEMPLQGSTVFNSNGIQFLRDWAIPHFFFHVVTAYDILRHHGVELGKRDYMSHIGRYIHQRSN